jgi:alkylated DNA repair protein (DNA oxidative demethylase)
MDDLFGDRRTRGPVALAEDALLLPAYADGALLYRLIEEVAAQAPFRKYVTRSGFSLSVAMSNCGSKGWVSDRRGYRYEALDPLTGKPWPPMPDGFMALAQNAAKEAGFTDFAPNACLINRYEVGTKMGLHQDKDEKDFAQPIVSVSIGLMARFQFGGAERSDPVLKYELHHGDVVVWGGKSRLHYHGIMPLKAGEHALTGPYRYNLTFRYASDF